MRPSTTHQNNNIFSLHEILKNGSEKINGAKMCEKHKNVKISTSDSYPCEFSLIG